MLRAVLYVGSWCPVSTLAQSLAARDRQFVTSLHAARPGLSRECVSNECIGVTDGHDSTLLPSCSERAVARVRSALLFPFNTFLCYLMWTERTKLLTSVTEVT